MRIRIVTSCTNLKAENPDGRLAEADFRLPRDGAAFRERETALEAYRRRAEEMYTGQQHARLMEGVRRARARGFTVEVHIVSAGYGLIPGDREIVPYELTFQGMAAGRLREWASFLRIPESFREIAARPADLLLVALGESYLRALGLDDGVAFAPPTLFLAGAKARALIAGTGPVSVSALGKEDTRRYSCGLVGLKGEVAKRMLFGLCERAAGGARIMVEPSRPVRRET